MSDKKERCFFDDDEINDEEMIAILDEFERKEKEKKEKMKEEKKINENNKNKNEVDK